MKNKPVYLKLLFILLTIMGFACTGMTRMEVKQLICKHLCIDSLTQNK